MFEEYCVNVQKLLLDIFRKHWSEGKGKVQMDGKNAQDNGGEGRVGITQADCMKAVQYTSVVGTFATLLYILT